MILDQINYLNQFQISLAWRNLATIFDSDFLDDSPDFSSPEAIFYSPHPSLGLRIGLDWLNNSQFNWQTAPARSVQINGETHPLTGFSNKLENWYDYLLSLKLAGIDIWTILQQVKPTFDQLSPLVNSSNNQAKQLAQRLAGKTILVITADQLETVGQWWRHCFENWASNLCFTQTISQINYQGWRSHPIDKPFGVIDITNPQDQTQFSQKNRQLSGKMPAAYQIKTTTKRSATELIELMLLAEATSYYLAALNKQSLRIINTRH